MENEKLGDIDAGKAITFEVGKPAEVLIKLVPGKFFWKGEEVTDTEKVYERFCEWLKRSEIANEIKPDVE